MVLNRSRILGLLLVLAGALAVVVGVGLLSVPAAVILAGVLVASLGASFLVEVR
jgi:hypothetical protein